MLDDLLPRFRRYEEFLNDNECVARVMSVISSIEAAPKDWWDIAVHINCNEAIKYHREVPPPPPPPPQGLHILGLVLTSTKHGVCPQAWAYVKTKGYNPHLESAVYSLLVALPEKDRNDKRCTILLGKLKGILGGEDLNSRSRPDRQERITKRMSELHCRRRLGAVRDKRGAQLSQPLKIATALKEHSEGVSKEGFYVCLGTLHFYSNHCLSRRILKQWREHCSGH